jgi:glycerol uptake facilitator-like aquaporin
LSIFGAEVIGTAILILLGNGVVAGVLLSQSKAENAGWIVITFGWGMGVMLAVFAVAAYSGAHLNPAVTFGFALEGTTEWSDVPKYFAGEFVGAFIGATADGMFTVNDAAAASTVLATAAELLGQGGERGRGAGGRRCGSGGPRSRNGASTTSASDSER